MSAPSSATTTDSTPAMKYRFLGDSGLLVSLLSFGAMTFTDDMGVDTAYEILKHAYAAGVNFIDNAETYANGRSEEIMGEAIARGVKEGTWTREDLVISTKIYFGAGVGPNGMGLCRKHIIEGTKDALKRSGLEYVDLVFCHRPEAHTPIEETVRAMNHVINQGLAFYWGTSEWHAHDVIKACEIADRLGMIRPLMDQPQYNIFERTRVEFEYSILYKKYKYGLTTWSPLSSGILAGKYSKGIPEGSRFSSERTMKWFGDKFAPMVAQADQLAEIASELDCSLAQLSIAWCAANTDVSTVMLGARSVVQLQENLQALAVVDKVTPEVRAKIDAIVPFVPKNLPQHTVDLRARYLSMRLPQVSHVASMRTKVYAPVGLYLRSEPGGYHSGPVQPECHREKNTMFNPTQLSITALLHSVFSKYSVWAGY